MYHYVYILVCSNGKHYTGCTSDLKERLSRHKDGQVNYQGFEAGKIALLFYFHRQIQSIQF